MESFFLKANDPASDRAFWLKFTILAPVGGREAVGEVWAILFDGHKEQRAAKETFPVEALALGPGGVGITLGECEFGPGRSRGRLRGKDGTVFRWDLRFDGERAPLKPFPYAWMYTAPFPKSKSLTPTSDTRFEGFVEAGELRFEVASWPGMQGHNWGKSHAERYAWAHCNVFADPDGRAVDAVFEGFSARIRLGPVVTPFLTACLLTHGGRTY
ncbi:MAG: hypothetical protein RBU30_14635, partial [Polyangia bacterium]|nr:hypothetical protein [Polyangia bacterium]